MNKRYLKNNSLAFVIIFACSIILAAIVGGLVYKIPSYQKIEFFISTTYIDDSYFNTEIKKVDGVKKVNIITRSPSNKYYEETLQTIGLYSDLLIIPEKYLLLDNALTSFSPIDEKYFDEYNLNYDSYQKIVSDGLCYGIIIYDKENDVNFFKDKIVFETDDRYVICVGKTTPNVINEPKNEKQNNNAYKALMELLAN